MDHERIGVILQDHLVADYMDHIVVMWQILLHRLPTLLDRDVFQICRGIKFLRVELTTAEYFSRSPSLVILDLKAQNIL